MNRIVEVRDIAVVKTVQGEKQLFSLRDQKIKKDSLRNFGAGSGVKYQGDLYVLEGRGIPVVRMTTTKNDPSFMVVRNGDIDVDWGDGTKETNVFSHTYTDDAESHSIVFYGKNTALVRLYCGNNQLTHLDVSQNTLLDALYCSTNQLTQLNISQNTALVTLEAAYNQLTQLDVRQNTALVSIYCHDNQLTHLDVSQNTALTKLNCGNNPFITDNTALITFADSLPDRVNMSAGFTNINNTSQQTIIQTICDEKNWIITFEI